MGRLGERNEISNIGSETSTVGLYDVCTVDCITPSQTNQIADIKSSEWKLKSKSNDRFLVLTSGSDLAVFLLGETSQYYFTTSLQGTISDFEIIGNSSFFVGIVEKRQIVILSLEKQTIYLTEEVPHEIDFVTCNPTPEMCYLTLGSLCGDWFVLNLEADVAAAKELNRLEHADTEIIQQHFAKAMQNKSSKKVELNGFVGDVTSVSNGPLQAFAAPGSKGIHYCGFIENQFCLIGQEKQWVQVRDGGRFSLNLDTDGWIHVFDPITHCFWHEFDVKLAIHDTILDFIVIDRSENDIPKLFAIVSKNAIGTTQINIFDRLKRENCFALDSVPATTLFAYGGGDRVLMAVEEIYDDGEDVTKSRIIIRQVSQSRPELRLESLIKHHRFEEAEKFANAFNLDVQKVYKSHIYYLTDRCDDDDEAFETLTRTMNDIKDHNMVAETYFSLVGMSRRCDRIRNYLTNAKKRKIGDMDVLLMIESVCHIWATYRIIAGPVEDVQIDEHVWELFVEALHGGDPWLEMYNEFIESSQFTKARVIFSRHGRPIIDYLIDENERASRLDALFRMFSDAISTNVGNWSSVVEHITTDIVPGCLDSLEHISECLENLIISLIPLLECRDAVNWPDNAIKAVSSYDTMTRYIIETENTPVLQGMLLLFGKNLTTSCNGRQSSSMSRVKKLYYDLKELKRLKEEFECLIRFSVFQTLTSEEICHKILQNALLNPNTTNAKIEKFVKPFMAERHLDQEQTIVNYIQMVSGAAVSAACNFGWEKQCVQLCDSLTDETRRCCSIVSIAASAKLPWPIELNEAVQKVLASRTLSRSEIEQMQLVCKRAELVKTLSSYSLARHDIERLADPDASMDVITTIRCMLAQREKSSRFVDTIRLLELIGSSTRCEFVHSHAVIHMMSHEEVSTVIINYIDSLGERERYKTIQLVFEFVARVADTPAIGSNVEARARLLDVGEQMLAYYMCRDNDYTDPLAALKESLVLLREVQIGEERAVLLSEMRDSDWQKRFMKKMVKANKESVTAKFNRCNYMGIPIEELLEMLVKQAMDENDLEKILESVVAYVNCIGPWTEVTREMLDPIPQIMCWVTYRLPELSVTETDATRADHIAIVIKQLAHLIREIIGKFPFEVICDDFSYLLQLEDFFYLGEQIIKQSLRGQEHSDDGSTTNTAWSDTRNTVVGFRHEFGTYDYSGDPALFEGVTGVLTLALVAPSVARPFQSEISDEDAGEFRASWEQLNMFLAMHSQDLLDISTRVFAGTLKCWSGEWRQGIIEIEHPVVSVVERMLQQKKFDFWHAVTLLGGLPRSKIEKVVSELARKPGVKSSTKATIQYLKLAFVMCILTDNFERMTMITHSFERMFLMKKLAEEGVRANIASPDFIDKVIQQAADIKKPLPPYRLYDYVKKYVTKLVRNSKIGVGEYMVRYATILTRKASNASRMADAEIRDEEIIKFVELAKTALRIAEDEEAQCICHYFRSLLYTVCPYNYQVIQFIVTAIGTYASNSDDEEFHKDLEAIMRFAWSYKRTNHLSKEESMWFTRRENGIVKDEKDFEKTSRINEPFGHSIRLMYENDDSTTSSASDVSFASDAMVYEKNSVIISDTPTLATRRLPFHCFLLRRKEDTDETVMAIVKAELSIFNVPVWQSYLREVSWLAPRFSRSQLLSSAIFTHVNKYAMFGKSLPPGERETIYHLLNSTSQRQIVISTIALLFKKIVLSEVKIELLQMGVDISESWTTDMSEEEKAVIVEQCERLKDGIAKFSTELELKKNGMFTEKTADKIEQVEELCASIYDEMIVWDNSADVAKKCRVVERIADANGLDLAVLHEKLVFDWIEDTDTAYQVSNVDMNESIGGTSIIDQKMDSGEEKDELRMPLFDTVLDKIVVLCQRIDKKRLLAKLAGTLTRSSHEKFDRYTPAVRACSVIFRIFTDADIAQFSPDADLIQVCGNLEEKLYSRLFDKAEVKYDQNTDKTQLIKTLLQCPSRSHPMTALIACLIIDNEYTDARSIEQVMTRLQISKQWSTLRSLLTYVRTHRLDSMIRSFPLLWFRVYENALIELNGGPLTNSEWSYEQGVMLRKWTLWAMSSNVEGGRQPNVARFLRELGCPAAASIVSVLSSWTVDKMDAVDVKKIDSNKDICLDWPTDASKA